MSLSLLLLRSLTHRIPKPPSLLSRLSHASAFHTETDRPKPPDPKPSLSARMSFVFDQIDAIEKDRETKDDALQRIRAWRETKKKKTQDDDVEKHNSTSLGLTEVNKTMERLFKKEVEVVHPWPEWVELMERLVHQNYFDHRRRDEDKIVKDLDIDVASFPMEEGYDFSRDWAAVRTACLNFGRDRFDILKSLSRQDLQILVGHGCPSTDKKVVFSGKILRRHVHLDEGDVCSSCNLRSTCEKAYLLSRKEDEARTIDVMRILLAYGFDPIKDTVENKSLLKLKTVKTVVRKLLHEVVKLSAVPIDPNLSPPIIKKPPPKVKQPPPAPRKRIGRDDIEMKKGDWLCPKCDFMNFAKNTVCLQCDAKRPKRQLLPGEWECPECNFLNYRRNMACFHCEHKRPHDEFMENQTLAKEKGPRTRFERVNDVPAGSSSWNFDFDDNESDGADVAAFEYADPPRMAEDFPEESHVPGGNSRGYDDSFETNRISRPEGRNKYSDHDQRKAATGFDDFDDEEDDDLDSYELEASNNNPIQEPSRNFSEVEGFSGSEDFDGLDHRSHVQRGPSRSIRKKTFSGSDDDRKGFDSDGEPSVYSDWKSSHVGDSRNGIKGSGRSGQYKKKAFDSDHEFDVDSDSDGDLGRSNGLNNNKRNKFGSNKRDFRRGGYSGSEDELGFGSESDDDDFPSHKSKFGGNRGGPVRRGSTFRGRGQFGANRDDFRSNDRMSDRRDSFGNTDHGRSSRGSHRNNRESAEDGRGGRRNSYGNTNLGRPSRGSFKNGREDGYNGRRSDDRQDYRPNSGSDRQRGGRGDRQNGRSNGFNDRSETVGNFTDDRPRRTRIIER